jgi:translin
VVEASRQVLAAVNGAREAGLPACRRAIRAAGSAIRSVHRRDEEGADSFIAESHAAIRQAQGALAPFPMVAYAGFLHDAEKEYAEAVLTRALVAGAAIPGPGPVGVGVPAWLNGLAEAASELRRHLLDRLRLDETAEAERLLGLMEDVYEALVGVDFPDAVTGGLRRSADSLRAVLERTRSDVTTTVMQLRLRAALEQAAPGRTPPSR